MKHKATPGKQGDSLRLPDGTVVRLGPPDAEGWQTMKYKTSELAGQNLRHAVALACGYRVEREDGDGSELVVWFPPEDVPRLGPCSSLTEHGFAPDIKREQGGYIIERERIGVVPFGATWAAILVTNQYRGDSYIDLGCDDTDGEGPTTLIAGMRAFVASKFGEEVEL